jgi:hypothetical protein
MATVLSVAIGTAHADSPAAVVEAAPQERFPVMIATNLPLLWGNRFSVAGSLYVGVSQRHAIRANVASYANHGHYLPDFIAGAAGGDGFSHSGRIADIGISWVYYPRRLWDGFLIEVGALRRARDVGMADEDTIKTRDLFERHV